MCFSTLYFGFYHRNFGVTRHLLPCNGRTKEKDNFTKLITDGELIHKAVQEQRLRSSPDPEPTNVYPARRTWSKAWRVVSGNIKPRPETAKESQPEYIKHRGANRQPTFVELPLFLSRFCNKFPTFLAFRVDLVLVLSGEQFDNLWNGAVHSSCC